MMVSSTGNREYCPRAGHVEARQQSLSLEYCFQHGSVRKECDNFQMFQDIWPC